MSLSACLDSGGFGLGVEPAPTAAPASDAGELEAQKRSEAQALAEVTAAALDAADSIADLDTFLMSQAAPQANVLRDESAALRTHLETFSRLDAAHQARPG